MACQPLELRAEIRAMQQQLKEKDEEIERGKREIDRCKREIESCKRSAAEAVAEAQNAHTAELAQYLEEKKSLDDFKRLVEKQRSRPWIIQCFPSDFLSGFFCMFLYVLVGWPRTDGQMVPRLQWSQERDALEAQNGSANIPNVC